MCQQATTGHKCLSENNIENKERLAPSHLEDARRSFGVYYFLAVIVVIKGSELAISTPL
jgi:hypothetical protein